MTMRIPSHTQPISIEPTSKAQAVLPQACTFWKAAACQTLLPPALTVCALDVVVGDNWCSCMHGMLDFAGCRDCVDSWFC
jgi:hypothetical protein